MWLFIAVVGALLQVLPSVEGRHFRIIDGRKATTLEFPYQVDIERYGRHWCGGSIIRPNIILTAAHCVKANEKTNPIPEATMRIRVGHDVVGVGGTIYQIQEVFPHEKYSDYASMDQYDIALMLLTKNLVLSDRVGLVALSAKTPAPGAKGWVSGYGKQKMMRSEEPRHLMAVEIPVVGLAECQTILRGVADDMICGGYKKGHKDSCTGDSGGPFVVNEEQVGIVAWGIGCGREGLPGVYTNVAMYKGWIEKKIREIDRKGKRRAEEEDDY